MAPKDASRVQVTEVSSTEDHEDVEQTDSEDEAYDVNERAGSSSAAGSSDGKEKKKRKNSKVSKALSALKGKSGVPDELVNRVLDKVKAEGSVPEQDLTTENIREVLNQLKIMDVVQGKAGIGGLNKTDMGEHKVGSRYLQGARLTQAP